MSSREELHALIDQLDEADASAALAYLRFLVDQHAPAPEEEPAGRFRTEQPGIG